MCIHIYILEATNVQTQKVARNFEAWKSEISASALQELGNQDVVLYWLDIA